MQSCLLRASVNYYTSYSLVPYGQDGGSSSDAADRLNVILTQPQAMRAEWMPAWAVVYDTKGLLAAVKAVELSEAGFVCACVCVCVCYYFTPHTLLLLLTFLSLVIAASSVGT
jgi:hypothetical protein